MTQAAFAYTVYSQALMYAVRTTREKRFGSNSDYDLALSAAERAIVLDPNFAPGYSALANVLLASGRSADSLAAAKKALRLDPLNQVWLYSLEEGLADVSMGRYQEAIPVLKDRLANQPNELLAHEWLAASYAAVGRLSDAQAQVAEVRRISPSFSVETQKRFSIVKEGVWDRNYAYLALAGLK
jgi:adenylate cyclase